MKIGRKYLCWVRYMENQSYIFPVKYFTKLYLTNDNHAIPVFLAQMLTNPYT